MRLAARDLSVGYGRRIVGSGLGLDVGPGEVLALLGPNGGGKTTLLKTVLGLLPPLAGSVTLDGAPLHALPVRERARRIAYVPQVHAGTFAFTVAEVVMMGRGARGSLFAAPSAHDHAVVAQAVARLGLAALADRPYTEISGGERQLALIARALAQEPAVVVLDEPTASLDFGNQGRVMREIGRLAAAGLAVLFSTHDPNHALRHAHRAMLIRDGRTIAQGEASAVLDRGTLEALYGTTVESVSGEGRTAFLPGEPPG